MPESRAPRAQIFQSFDSLEGFRDIIAAQEKIVVPVRHLAEDDLDALNREIIKIKKGSMVRVVYSEDGKYIELEGKVTKINFTTHFLQIVKKKLNFTQLYEIEIIEENH